MVKRFTDTELWEEDWFISLPQSLQFFWIYLKDNCDHAGIWKPNMAKFTKLYGYEINLKEALENINNGKDRITPLKNGRWFLTGFIPFQYGSVLNLNSRMHLSVYQLLELNEVNLGSIRPQITLIQRVKDKDKDKDKKEVEDVETDFGRFWKAYPKKKSKGQAERAWKKINPGKEQIEVILKAIDRAKRSQDWLKDFGQFIPYPASWLNAKGWEDELVGIQPSPDPDKEKKLAEAQRKINELAERVIQKRLTEAVK